MLKPLTAYDKAQLPMSKYVEQYMAHINTVQARIQEEMSDITGQVDVHFEDFNAEGVATLVVEGYVTEYEDDYSTVKQDHIVRENMYIDGTDLWIEGFKEHSLCTDNAMWHQNITALLFNRMNVYTW